MGGEIVERRRAMRTSILILVAAVLAAGFAPAASGQEHKNPAICRAIPNLLLAIQSDNAGLRESAAYYLGEYKCRRAVIPLLAILKNDPRPSTRAVAALALCRIGDERGLFAVRRAVLFDDNIGVKGLCAWYYNEYVEPGSYAIIMRSEGTPPTLATQFAD
jgi:hypothetical protein